jgi:hypothetical protein
MKKYFLFIILFALASIQLFSQINKSTTESLPSFIDLKVDGKLEIIKEQPLDTKHQTQEMKIQEGTWNLLDSVSYDIFLFAGSNYGVKFNRQNRKLEPITTINLSAEAKQAVAKAPKWLRLELTNTFSALSIMRQRKLAKIINDAVDPYIDEIAFAIAYSSPAYLTSNYCYNELFAENAMLLYRNDSALKYVDIVDYGDSKTDENYYSTVKYRRIDTAGNKVQVEVPKEIYYFYLVHPKLSDEIAAYVDPAVFEHDASMGNHTYNIAAPPAGVFWRDFLFNHTEPIPGRGDTLFPILKEQVSQCDVLWDDRNKEQSAIRTMTKWINDVMDFTSENERPHQPVRIYSIHIGRCGEHDDITNATSRSCLVPCREVSTISTDHVWNEFWDEDWQQWEPVNNSHRDKLCYYGWGKKFGTVWSRRSDGTIDFATKEYIKDGVVSTINITVNDKSNKPIDGAQVLLFVRDLTDTTKAAFDSYQITNSEGKCTFIVGTERIYFVKVNTPYGNFPAQDGYVGYVTSYPQGGQTVNTKCSIAGTKPKANFTAITDPEDNTEDFFLKMNFNVEKEVINWGLFINDLDGETTYNSVAGGKINSFITDETNYKKCDTNMQFDACHPVVESQHGSPSGMIAFNIPDNDNWYAFTNNDNSSKNYQHVTGYFSLYISPTVDVKDNPGISNEAISNLQLYPNPFNSLSSIRFSLNKASNLSVSIYNSQGNKVKTLYTGQKTSGDCELIWDGTDNNNKPASNGLYFYRIDSDSDRLIKNIVLLR